MDAPYCKAHHCPRTECRPVDTHVESIRVSDTLWDAVTRKAEAEGTYRNDAITQALTAWLDLPDYLRAPIPETGLGPRKPRTFRVTVAQWAELAKAAGGEPSSCVNAAILAWAMPDYAGALRNAAEIAAAAPRTRKPAARTGKPATARTEPPAPAPVPRDGRAPVVAELQDRIRQMETVPAAAIFQEPGAQRVIKGIAPDETPEPARKKRACKHPNMRMAKGVCPDCHEWVTRT